MKTTTEHFNTFQKECEYWINKFHLREWEFRFVHKTHEEIKNSRAWYEYNWEGRLVTIGLTEDWDKIEITEYEIVRSAFHEACEILLADLETIARIDICPSQKGELTVCKHSIIRRLEWSVWRPDYESRRTIRAMGAGQTCPQSHKR